MRSLVTAIVLMGITLGACNEVGLNELSVREQESLVAMEQEIFNAVLYNDSLANYIKDTGINNDQQCQYFDYHFHTHDSLYNIHHNNYSHAYGWDDHTMGNGGMMVKGGGMSGNFPGGMGHYQSDHNFMDSLHIAHQEYHPE